MKDEDNKKGKIHHTVKIGGFISLVRILTSYLISYILTYPYLRISTALAIQPYLRTMWIIPKHYKLHLLLINHLFQIIIIWSITALATISTVSGIGAGIRRLSEVCFGLGIFLILNCFLLDDTFYILNLIVQSTGEDTNIYVHTIPYLSKIFNLPSKICFQGSISRTWFSSELTLMSSNSLVLAKP